MSELGSEEGELKPCKGRGSRPYSESMRKQPVKDWRVFLSFVWGLTAHANLDFHGITRELIILVYDTVFQRLTRFCAATTRFSKKDELLGLFLTTCWDRTSTQLPIWLLPFDLCGVGGLTIILNLTQISSRASTQSPQDSVENHWAASNPNPWVYSSLSV